MKHLLALIVLATALPAPTAAEIVGMNVQRAATEEEMKGSITRIELQDESGARFSLRDLMQNGKPTLITLWAHWCANRRAEMTDYKIIASTCPQRWNVIFVSSRAADFARDLAKYRAYGLPWIFYHVAETSKTDERTRTTTAFYGATKSGEVITPLHYLVSSNGLVDAIVNARMNLAEPKKLTAFCR